MPTTISNPATFSSVRTAFNTEGYGLSTSFNAYRQGGGIVPSTSTFNVIGAGTAGDPLRLTQFNGFTVPALTSANLTNHVLTAYVGQVFSGTASTSMTFNNTGTLTWSGSTTNGGTGRYIEFDGTRYASSASNSGTVSGEWRVSGSSSSFQIYVTRVGSLGGITGGSFGTWITLSTSVTVYLNSSTSDDAEVFNIQIRDASTLTVLDTCTITLEALSAGLN